MLYRQQTVFGKNQGTLTSDWTRRMADSVAIVSAHVDFAKSTPAFLCC